MFAVERERDSAPHKVTNVDLAFTDLNDLTTSLTLVIPDPLTLCFVKQAIAKEICEIVPVLFMH
jgi:hypothetical protein